jgi:molecular chaperone GrpE
VTDTTPNPDEATAEEEAQDPTTDEAPTDDLNAQLDEMTQKANEYLEGWRKAQAEMINYKRRAEKQREQAAYETRERLVRGLLPILDDFDLAAQQMPDDIKNNEWVEGMFAIRRKLMTEIANLGVEELDPLGDEYDPMRHEAIAQAPSEDYQSGHVMDVLRKGYVLGDKVIRPAMVRVAQ